MVKKKAGIPIREQTGEVLSLMRFKGTSLNLEPSIFKHRCVGQTPDELMALIATDFSAVRSEADQLHRSLREQTGLHEWRQYITKNPPSADAIAGRF